MRTYGQLSFSADRWIVSGLEPHVVMRLKANFNKIPKASPGPFAFPNDPLTAADLAWFISRYPLAAKPEDLAHLDAGRTAFVAVQAEVGRIMAVDYTPPAYSGLRDGQSVRVHQSRAVEMLRRFGGLLVGDEMGEGKTYTGGAACLLPGALPATIVCPPHLCKQWADKLAAFTTLTTHIVTKTTPYVLPPCDVRIFSYSRLSGWADILEMLGTGLVIFDEAHELRNGVGNERMPVLKGVAAMRLAMSARMRLALTGTPIFNYGNEIWNLMSFIRPNLLGDEEEFYREWCMSGRVVKDAEALGTYLREQHGMLRKLSDGPKPNVTVQEIDHDQRELDRVEHLAHALAIKATSGRFEERGQAVRELDLMLRYQTGVAKAKAVAAYARMIAEAGEPLILFGWHREVYEIWLTELSDLKPVMYTGSETPKRKEEAKQAFLDGETMIFIMSLRSGAGVDGLQARARTAVFGELDWSPAMHAQCVGRLNREGQACWPEAVDAIYLVADDGSDPPMMEVLGLKASQAHSIVDPGLGVQSAARDESRLQTLVHRYLAKREAA